MRSCRVYIHNHFAGILSEKSPQEYSFSYNADYLKRSDCAPVCLALPVSDKEYHSDVLFPYFFNMLSEGANRRMQSELHHIDTDDDFGILLATAQYDTPGAVTIEPIK